MIRNLLLSIHSSIIFSSNNPEIYNLNSIKIDGHYRNTLEHIFPKCYMNKISYNDLHNIFKCNGNINNLRSNYKYTDNNNITDLKRLYNTDNYISNKEKLFIPEKESRGIIARAIMYMSFEYKYKYSKIIDTDLLINWCLEYPPTKAEINHNNDVFKRQFKRNKFIDLYCKKNYKRYINNLFNE
jgi:endonuclease I